MSLLGGFSLFSAGTLPANPTLHVHGTTCLHHPAPTDNNCVCAMFEADAAPEMACRFEADCPSIKERIVQWEIALSPNPITTDFSVLVNGAHPPAQLEVTIADRHNRIVLHAGQTTGRHLDLTAEMLPPGDYYLQFSMAGEVVLKKRFLVYRR